MSDDLEPTVDDLREGVGFALVALLDHAQGSDDPHEVARCLAALRDAKADAATVYADVEKHLLSCMGERAIEVQGLGVFETKRRTKRTGWDHDSLVQDVIDTVDLLDPANDDFPAPWAVVQALRECVSFGAGKVRGPVRPG